MISHTLLCRNCYSDARGVTKRIEDGHKISPCPFQATIPPLEAFDKMISVKVGFDGKETETFLIYRGLLTFQSAYFNRLLNGSFKEAGSDEIRVRTISPADFKPIYLWLNTRHLYSPEDTVPISIRKIMVIYVFGDAYIIPRLKNASIEAFIEKVCAEWNSAESVPTTWEVNYLYENTTGDCGMRAVLVKNQVDTQTWSFDRGQELCRDFVLDILEAMKDPGNHTRFITSIRDPLIWFRITEHKICDFHDHSKPNPE